uniref:Family with sequence similarity 53 member C n=1 Tax=Gopherus evgoodei TaxID=1825980 RepID=A0A8C4WK47_9SAUR
PQLKRASWWDLISCPRIHLHDYTGFSCHHSGLSLSPCSQDCCPKTSLPSQTLATDPLTLGKASVVPTKRHCCSPSVPENFFHWHPLCRPLGSKVWTPIKHRGSSGEGALEEQPPIPDHGACSLSPPFFSLALSRESLPFPLQRRFSLSPVQFLPSPQSSASSTPELLRHQHGLPHSQSQPCDLDTKKNDLKRCHDEDAKWHRPSLNFYKMNQGRLSGPYNCTPCRLLLLHISPSSREIRGWSWYCRQGAFLGVVLEKSHNTGTFILLASTVGRTLF